MSYYINRIVEMQFDTAVAKAREELKNEGFGVLTEIDVKATLKKKLDVDFRNYIILGACNPPFAYQALQTESNIGVMLPCNVVLQETEDGSTEISAINPLVAMASVNNPDLAEIAEQIRNKLAKVVESI
ncbi:DUF302 domain-containing protein [bacterium]|nr:DUF302 domain-containing protein [bacterium]MBU1025095.1 DUF302 domain-containing protein [bacterium]